MKRPADRKVSLLYEIAANGAISRMVLKSQPFDPDSNFAKATVGLTQVFKIDPNRHHIMQWKIRCNVPNRRAQHIENKRGS